MGSLGTGEILFIALVALIVFGPKRLPELARKAGEMLTKAREATKSVTSALDSEYDGITAPLQDLKSEYDSTVKGFKDAASTATGFSVDMTGSRREKPTEPPTTDKPVEQPSNEATTDQPDEDKDQEPPVAEIPPETAS